LATLRHFLCEQTYKAQQISRAAIGGVVILDSGQEVSVKLLVPQGTSIRDAISKLIQKGKTSAQFDFLVLFSLDPVALHDAATQSTGEPVEVKEPLQLIIYGEAQTE